MADITVDTGGEEHRIAAKQLPFSLPAGATEIVLVRHGASADAIPGRRFPLVDGHSDPPLAPAGERQADLIAARLETEPLAGIYVTPLRRTHRTAEPLVAATGIEPTVIDELVEVGLGDWEGGEWRLRVAAGDPIVKRVFEEERWDVIPGGESDESLSTRVRTGILRIAELTGPDRIAAAILHGGVIGEVCRQATSSSPLAFSHSDNGSISRVVIGADGRWMLRAFNDISHLVDLVPEP
jgi:2,3-bisphosphoglycerate-dependent phosphoglycerate mutase